MDTLNSALSFAGGLLLAPFRDVPALGLVFWSVVSGVLMSFVFGKTSNQRALGKAADSVRAQLFAIKLFKEDLVVTLRCQVALLRATGLRLLHSLPPMGVMALPLLFVLAQLAMHYDHRPLVDGERAVVAVRVKPDRWKETRGIALRGGDNFEVETQGLRDERSYTIYWRVRVAGNEPDQLRWEIGSGASEERIAKVLPVAANRGSLVTASPKRSGRTLWDRLLYPAEPCIPAASPVDSIELQLPLRNTPILGLNIPWWATFFGVSMLAALIAGKFIGVRY